MLFRSVVLLAAEGHADIISEGETYPLNAGEAMLLPAVTENITIKPRATAKILETYIETNIRPMHN